MASCEKCWDDAARETLGGIGQAERYAQLVKTRCCTPEEQAGGNSPESAGVCPKCNRKTLHRVCNVCMNCGFKKALERLAIKQKQAMRTGHRYTILLNKSCPKKRSE